MRRARWVTTVAIVAVAAVGCGDDDQGAEAEPAAAVPTGDVIFEDPLDDDGNDWGVVDDDNGSLQFEEGDYVWAFAEAPFAHFLPGALEQLAGEGASLRDVVVSGEVTVERGGGVVGVFCREVADQDAEFQWYEFVVRDGFAAIRIADLDTDLEVLAETDDVDVPLGEPVAIEGACVDDDDGTVRLTMSLDGEPVLEATDPDGLGDGIAGLQAYEAPEAEVDDRMIVRWHDFAVHERG